MLDAEIYKQALNTFPHGVFILDENQHIQAWNNWLAEKTAITAEQAYGRTLVNVFPKFNSARFNWAVEHVLEYGYPQVLSQILNRYLIPIKLPRPDGGFTLMPQHVEVLPLSHNQKSYALVVITDASDLVFQKQVLMEIAYKLEENSFRDALTNIYNRRYMWSWLSEHFAEAKRIGFSIACCLYDIDFFKQINDQLGHEEGDKVLVAFVELVKKTIRPTDIFIRYGGEEFVVLLPNISLEHATTQAERIRKTVEKSSLSQLPTGKVTCSVGIAYWEPSNPMTNSQLLEKADQALYQAKRNGRNRVVFVN